MALFREDKPMFSTDSIKQLFSFLIHKRCELVKFHSPDAVPTALIHLDLIIDNGDTATTDWAPVTGFIPGQIRFIKGIINKRGKHS